MKYYKRIKLIIIKETAFANAPDSVLSAVNIGRSNQFFIILIKPDKLIVFALDNDQDPTEKVVREGRSNHANIPIQTG